MSLNLLDVVLLVLVLAYAVSGYWQGFVTGAFATAGLLLGGLFGVWAAPRLLGNASPSVWVSLGALFIMLLCASLGQGILQFAGARIRDRITWQPVRSLDAVGGAALSVVAVLVVAWALGVAASGARLPWVSKEIRRSEVLSRVNSLMPASAVQMLTSFNDVVGSSFFPRYLEPFAAERIVRVGPPPRGIARDPQVVAAGQSVLKVRGVNRCGRGVEGSGFLYAPDRLMTNAHVVAGVTSPKVLVGNDEVDAEVVYYNPDLDVAVLKVDGIDRPTLQVDTSGRPRDPGAVLGYPQDGPYDVQPARIRAEQRLRSPDIYGRGTVIREVFSVRSLIRPGNSGGPLVSADGKVYGVVFAASVEDKSTGYALTADQVAKAGVVGRDATTPVATGRCA
ncbi:MarP family serine protease [Nocardioides marmoribigeumensis]|uniref:S1-C subfamily serine protease n=1 Tax=Nocardioides marmoribigeumensis TaxID=433649 RepID=A0ABU2BWT5_9ACTN|nr:MarP family serine protease [Nocardioides marmoribigeumensis]MDR7362149.1 S1-C subfamily serine protease [Nocardioides marmoribigeumensis]